VAGEAEDIRRVIRASQRREGGLQDRQRMKTPARRRCIL
jgi:hypothetical protein